MPIHDWTRVPAGTWHAFHLSWISAIQETLNEGLLPAGYYAQAEQIIGPLGPDVLALQQPAAAPTPPGGTALLTTRPRLRVRAETEASQYAPKRRTIIIRHVSGDRIVALLEIVSPGNKGSAHAARSFVEKVADALHRGYHLSLVDLFPPNPRIPQGIHAAIWDELGEGDAYALPADEPLTLAAYTAGPVTVAFIEPTALGRELIALPLYLTEEGYVEVPLEATYRGAYRGVPRRWKDVLEAA